MSLPHLHFGWCEFSDVFGFNANFKYVQKCAASNFRISCRTRLISFRYSMGTQFESRSSNITTYVYNQTTLAKSKRSFPRLNVSDFNKSIFYAIRNFPLGIL